MMPTGLDIDHFAVVRRDERHAEHLNPGLTPPCHAAWWSMRPWESVSHPAFPFGRSESQDRMDLSVMVMRRGYGIVKK
jgi:hypothetical protein